RGRNVPPSVAARSGAQQDLIRRKQTPPHRAVPQSPPCLQGAARPDAQTPCQRQGPAGLPAGPCRFDRVRVRDQYIPPPAPAPAPAGSFSSLISLTIASVVSSKLAMLAAF